MLQLINQETFTLFCKYRRMDDLIFHGKKQLLSLFPAKRLGIFKFISYIFILYIVSQDVLQKATKSMETNLSKLERELENCGDSEDPEDKFKEVMSEFYNQAKEQSELLVEMFNNMTNMFKELADYYCFDLKKTQLEDFFGDLSSFLQQYANAKKDNIKRKEREEKERKAKERAVSLVIYSVMTSDWCGL